MTTKVKTKSLFKWLANGVVLLVAGLGLVWGISSYNYYKKYEVTEDAQIEAFITPVNARIGGYIQSVKLEEHQEVKEGDTLVVIDSREIQIRLSQARAALMEVDANQKSLEYGLQTRRNQVQMAESGIDELEIRMKTVEKNLQRYKNLLEDKSIARVQYEQIETEYDALKAKLRSALEQKNIAEIQVKEVQNQMNILESKKVSAEAAVQLAELNLSYTSLLAPHNGYTGRNQLQVGQLVQPGQSLVSIVGGDEKWVVANFLEKQISNLQEGQEVEIVIDAYEDEPVIGKVVSISKATGARFSMMPTDNSAGNFVKIQQRIPVHIGLPNLDQKTKEKLRAGMNVVVRAEIQ